MFNDYGISASLSYDGDPLAATHNFFTLDAGTKTTVNAKIEEVLIFSQVNNNSTQDANAFEQA